MVSERICTLCRIGFCRLWNTTPQMTCSCLVGAWPRHRGITGHRHYWCINDVNVVHIGAKIEDKTDSEDDIYSKSAKETANTPEGFAEIRDTMRETLVIKRRRSNSGYDATQREFRPVDEVFCFYYKTAPKWYPQWKWPYRVTRKVINVNYEIGVVESSTTQVQTACTANRVYSKTNSTWF